MILFRILMYLRIQETSLKIIYYDRKIVVTVVSSNFLHSFVTNNWTCNIFLLFLLFLECGISNRQMRVVGGNVTKIHEFPWLAGLSKNGEFYCGAALITRRHLLTAAHCVYKQVFYRKQLKLKVIALCLFQVWFENYNGCSGRSWQDWQRTFLENHHKRRQTSSFSRFLWCFQLQQRHSCAGIGRKRSIWCYHSTCLFTPIR